MAEKIVSSEDVILKTLEQIVGPSNATCKIPDLVAYEKDQNWPFVKPHLPDYVVKAHNKKQVREIVRLSNRNLIPLIPLASGINVRGLCIPTQGGIILDMRDMNKILEINTEMMTATIQPGVSSAQLSAACRKLGVRPAVTSAPDTASIFANYMLIGLYHTSSSDGNLHILSMEIILPSGEIIKTGSGGLIGSPGPYARAGGPDLTGLFTGQPGAFGVATEMTVKLYPLEKFTAMVAYGYDDWEPAIEAGKRAMDAKVAMEVDIIDDNLMRMFLAPISDPKMREQIEKILPRVLVMTAIGDTVKERMKINKKIAEDISKEVEGGTKFAAMSAGGLSELTTGGRITVGMLERGYYHCFAFYGPLNMTVAYADLFYDTAEEHGFNARLDSSCLAIPQAPWNGQQTYFEGEVLTVDPTIDEERERILEYSEDVVHKLLDLGIYGWFRPYAETMDLTLERWGTTGEFMKRIKQLIDPNHIMNPGKFIF